MKIRGTRSLLALAGAALLVTSLSACITIEAPAGGDAAPETTSAPSPSEPPTTTPAPDEPVVGAPNTIAFEDGDCGYDPDAGALSMVAFVITADDSVTPVELTYSVFVPGSDPVVRKTESVGPVITVIQTECGSGVASAPWTFTATSPSGGSLGCVSSFGGKILRTASDYAEGDTARGVSVDCSGHPGM
ncbi:hypothetical protein ET445_01670 [Agromyces protaetiae]|uniref:Lipoprotein n=1 Tax=Agromyces protaetiae TaxID=2509455 RepID=A0A4P6FET7_9MICO|nr:hypothetical protein [Agromyces protaetiae]QAY72237.1 hypothetical protein ET445_01670 [Agromyces protaetiae]